MKFRYWTDADFYPWWHYEDVALYYMNQVATKFMKIRASRGVHYRSIARHFEFVYRYEAMFAWEQLWAIREGFVKDYIGGKL